MRRVPWFGLTVLLAPLAAIGCGGTGTQGADEQQFELKGKVVAVDAEKSSVTLDHDEIPGFMKAMKGMKFRVERPEALAGISPGDEVRGKLRVKSGEQVITRLDKIPAGVAKEEAAVEANLARLAPEDRKLAEAQKLCTVSGERLGDPVMGVPVKLTVKDRPVFLCCKSCTKKALADPEKTLAKMEELKAKNAAAKP